MMVRNKKALMGIGTLIIFIATILVAAVAAAVLISTSNVLQQRSLLVGQEARKSITNAIEVISVLSGSNSTDETFNDFEILVRLSPGSDALQMRLFDLQYISLFFDQGADLFYNENQTNMELGQVNTSWAPLYDLDGDDVIDSIRIVNGSHSAADFFQVNLTYLGLTNVSIGYDLSDAGTTPILVMMDEAAITFDEDVYGIISVNGRSDDDLTLNASATVIVKEVPSDCSFDVLQPESKYCYQIVNGNNDMVLNSGERFKLLYRVKHENRLPTGNEISFIFTNEKGRMTEASMRTPDVVVSTKTKLWPLG